jgi:hypothetical protein
MPYLKEKNIKKWAKRQLVPIGTCVASNPTYLLPIVTK